MSKVSYSVGQGKCRETIVSLSPCPHNMRTPKYDIAIHVGGQACIRCKHFVSKDVGSKEVTCAHS